MIGSLKRKRESGRGVVIHEIANVRRPYSRPNDKGRVSRLCYPAVSAPVKYPSAASTYQAQRVGGVS